MNALRTFVFGYYPYLCLTVFFVGSLSRTNRLSPGTYKLTATPTDAAHHTGQPHTTNLVIALR